MTYTAVLFDLFDTLVRFDRDRMPEIQVNGRTVRSTAGHLHPVPWRGRSGGGSGWAAARTSDSPPPAVDTLEREGVARRFSAIVVSDAVGWRKPKREIFDEALRRLDVGVDEALFVGDRADIDVLGAQQIGMDAAWINPEGAPLPPGITPPRYELRDLADLGAILGV